MSDSGDTGIPGLLSSPEEFHGCGTSHMFLFEPMNPSTVIIQGYFSLSVYELWNFSSSEAVSYKTARSILLLNANILVVSRSLQLKAIKSKRQ